MTTHRFLLPILALATVLSACASSESVHSLSRAQRAAIEELALAWTDEHTLVRANLAVLVEQRLILTRGRIHRELLTTACIDPDGVPDTVILAAAIADPTCDIALVREVRLGRMTEPDAGAWLTDYATALRLTETADGDTVRERLLAHLAEVESITTAWNELQVALDHRAQRIITLAQEATGASDDLAAAVESRIAWRDLGADAAPEAINPIIDALFKDEPRRAAARALLEQLLGADTNGT